MMYVFSEKYKETIVLMYFSKLILYVLYEVIVSNVQIISNIYYRHIIKGSVYELCVERKNIKNGC